MSLSAGLSSYIYNAANATLQKNGLAPVGGANVGLGYSLSASASSSATATGKSGDISGGTAFNIGGINFGTQNQPVTAEGGTPAQSVAGVSGSASALVLPIVIGVALLAVVLLLRK